MTAPRDDFPSQFEMEGGIHVTRDPYVGKDFIGYYATKQVGGRERYLFVKVRQYALPDELLRKIKAMILGGLSVGAKQL
jgi:hypothetical protein